MGAHCPLHPGTYSRGCNHARSPNQPHYDLQKGVEKGYPTWWSQDLDPEGHDPEVRSMDPTSGASTRMVGPGSEVQRVPILGPSGDLIGNPVTNTEDGMVKRNIPWGKGPFGVHPQVDVTCYHYHRWMVTGPKRGPKRGPK